MKAIRILLLIAAAFGSATYGQTSTATLRGQVTDDNGAAVVGASVLILNTDTGTRRTVITDSDGSFTIPLLQPSTYQLTVQQTNFAPFEVTDLVLNTNDNRFLNIRLKVGRVDEKVVVEASTVEVDRSSAVATVVDQNMVERIPMNGRTIQNLMALTPGVIPFTASSSSNVGQISVNGLRTTQNYMTIDGVSANLYVGTTNGLTSQSNGLVPGFSQLGTTSNLVSVDALQEFKVQTSNYSAEYGRTPGAQIQLTTRPGQNDFHGSLFEYFRNEKLDANDWFANANNLGRAPLRHNNFGGTVSGPIVSPRFGESGPLWWKGKDKAFFFLSYEGSRIRLPQTLVTTVPSRNMRSTAHVALRPFFSIYPEPTGPDNANGFSAPYVTNYSNPQEQDSYSARIDVNLTQKLTIFGRYSQSPQENKSLLPSQGIAQSLHGDTRTFTVGANAVFSPKLTNEFRFNWSRNSARNSTGYFEQTGTSPVDPSIWRPAPFTGRSQILYSFPGTSFNSIPNISGLRRQINITDTVTWVAGDHLVKAGLDYRRSPTRQESPDFQFVAIFSTLASVQSGIAPVVSIVLNNPLQTDTHWENFGAFLQDTWRVTERLTLDVGVRWDLNPPPDITPERRFVIVDFVNPIRLAEPGAKLYPTIWTAFAPRFGMSYLVSDKAGKETVIRGGYGLFYDIGSAAGAVPGTYFPFTATRTVTNAAFPFSAAVLTAPVISTTPPYSQGSFIVQYDKDFVLPRVHQWNVAIEQGLGKNQTLSVTYAANAGRRFLRSAVLAPISRVYPIASPDFAAGTNLTLFSNAPGRGDSSDYKSLQTQFSRRGNNISTIVNYTWSHSTDTSSATSNVLSTNSFRVDPEVDRADSAFDRRHVFSAALTWNLPAISRKTSAFLNAITRDWGFDAIVQYQTAYPIEISYRDNTTTNNLGSTTLRPDLVEGQPIWIAHNGPLGRRINPAAFSIPTTTRQGNMPRNFIRVGSLFQPDIGLSRTFGITEKVKLKLKGEMFNFINHPMFASPVIIMGTKNTNGTFTASPTFGLFDRMLNRTPSGEGISLSSIYAPGGPRSVQLSMKLSF